MTTIDLKGDLSVANAEDLRKMFKAALQKKTEVTVNVSSLEDIDVSIIQLVYALVTGLLKEKRELIFSGTFSPTVKKRLYSVGLIPSANISDEACISELTERMRLAV